MGPLTGMMSHNGSFRNTSDLPTNVERDNPPDGNFCATHTRLINNYTSAHPIAIGSSNFSRTVPHRPIPRSQSYDIAPKPHAYELFKDEAKRLETFSDWPSNAPVQKEDLARNGFIYLHVTDKTQCVFCRGILSSWEFGDIVENEHKRNCPECPLAFGYECGNRPIVRPVRGETLQPQQQALQTTFNTTVNIPAQPSNTYQHTYHIVRNVTSEDEVGHRPISNDISLENRFDASGNFQLPSIPQQQSLPGGTGSEPKYSQWADENLRIQSFMGWPAQMSQKPRDLAQAGLIYMATGDRCKCFWCGGELYEWEPQDDPMEEHAKWFPQCNYIRKLKGDAYIQYVKDKQNGLIVDPSELMSKPHVLAVLHMGYTQEQIEEAVQRYGVSKLISANDIIQAIDQITRERRARLEQINLHNSLQHSTESNRAPLADADDDDISMEIEESEINPPEQTNVKEATSGNKQDSLQSTSQNNSATVPSSSSKPISSKDVDSVLLENEKLKDIKLCKICMDRDLCITFLPCSHLVTCAECSKNLQECPVCRKKIQQKVKVFWS